MTKRAAILSPSSWRHASAIRLLVASCAPSRSLCHVRPLGMAVHISCLDKTQRKRTKNSVSDRVIGGQKMSFLKIAMITITINRVERDKRPSVWTPTSWRSGWCCRKKVNMSCHVSSSGKASSLSPATDPSHKSKGFASSSCAVTRSPVTSAPAEILK